MTHHTSYWTHARRRFAQNPLGVLGLIVFLLISFMTIYAPFFAASKPLCILIGDSWYFPLFRYLFSSAYYTKLIDIFYNVVAIWLPLFLVTFRWKRNIRTYVSFIAMCFFIYISCFHVINPASDKTLSHEKEISFQTLLHTEHAFPDFDFELHYMNDYAKLNLILDTLIQKQIHKQRLSELPNGFTNPHTLFNVRKEIFENQLDQALVHNNFVQLNYLLSKQYYIEQQLQQVRFVLFPLFSLSHWEENGGGDQRMNRELPFWALSRIGRQDLISALLFGARISLFVGLAASCLTFVIGVPCGILSGYFGGKLDLFFCRAIEVWESMPAFFMLLMIVSLVGSKSIFLIIAIISLFGWTTSFRYVRAETLRQRELSYIDASRAMGFSTRHIVLSELLPNCIVPVLALLPFDIMAAITREAGLAFLGLGEEHSCSWGVLMDEGRQAFPQESMLLWPPAILLTILLMAIALVGNALQTALDPKDA